MERTKAFELLKTHVKNEALIRHCLATEAIMRALALKLGGDQDKWGVTGLLHDIDVELTAGDITRHTLEAEKILREHDCAADIIEAVKMHNEAATGKRREELFHKALAAGETITGLVMATAMVYPDKKLASVKPTSIIKRMKDKRFAAGVDRNIVMECEQIGIPLPEFAELALTAMRGISAELGL
jgi:uncharacterized protein